MALIEWDKSFDTNLEMINKQHRMLMNMINDLYDNMNSVKERDVDQKDARQAQGLFCNAFLQRGTLL